MRKVLCSICKYDLSSWDFDEEAKVDSVVCEDCLSNLVESGEIDINDVNFEEISEY